MTTQNDLDTIITALETNLIVMGVTNAEYNTTDGVIGLINRILDIPPASGGILTTVLTCSTNANLNNVEEGDSITLAGTLSCVYNGASTIGWNINTVLANQSIKLYNGDTLITTLTTDSNGAYSYSYTVPSGVSSIIAVFEGNSVCASSSSSSISFEIISHEIELTFNGTNFILGSEYENFIFRNSLTDTDVCVTVDWGENTTENYCSGIISHQYQQDDTHTIKITGDYNTLDGFDLDWESGLITEINFPNCISTIKNSFNNPNNIPTNMVLPEGLTSIDYSFEWVGAALSSITFPSTIQEINQSFMYMDNLETVVFKASTPPTVDSGLFYGAYGTTVYVPAGSLSAYQSALQNTSLGYSSNTYIEY